MIPGFEESGPSRITPRHDHGNLTATESRCRFRQQGCAGEPSSIRAAVYNPRSSPQVEKVAFLMHHRRADAAGGVHVQQATRRGAVKLRTCAGGPPKSRLRAVRQRGSPPCGASPSPAAAKLQLPALGREPAPLRPGKPTATTLLLTSALRLRDACRPALFPGCARSPCRCLPRRAARAIFVRPPSRRR